MASNTAKLGVLVEVNDAQLKAAMQTVANFQNALGGATQKAIQESQKVAQQQKQAFAQSNADRKKMAEDTANALKAAEDRLNAAKIAGLSTVRQKIYEFELQKRKLALESANTLDQIRQKEIASETKKINAELQLYRSAEKEKTGGRTFTEQLENNFNSRLLTNISVFKTQFMSFRETLSTPIPAGSGIMGFMGKFGSAAIPVVGGAVAVGVALKGVIDIGSKFEDSVAELGAITGLSGQSLENLSTKARTLAKTYGIDASEGVNAFKLVISALGPDIAKNQGALNIMGNDILTLAKASGVTAVDATQALTTTLNQFGYNTLPASEQAKEMTRIMNVLAAGALQGAAEVPDLGAAMKEVGVVAKQSGVSVEGATAAIEILSMNGIRGAEAGTQYRNVLMFLSSGTKEAEKALASMGLTFKDVNPQVVGQEKALATLKAGFDSIKDPTAKAAAVQDVFRRENAAAAQILLQNVDGLHKMTAEVTGTATAQEQAAKRMATFSEGMNRLKAQGTDLLITAFNAIQPLLSSVMKAFEQMLPTLEMVAKVLGGALKIAFDYFSAPIRIVIALVQGAIGAFKALWEKFIEGSAFAKVLVSVFESVKASVQSVWNWVVDKYEKAQILLNKISAGTLGKSREELDAARKKEEENTSPDSGIVKVAPGALGNVANPADAKAAAKARKTAYQAALDDANTFYAESYANLLKAGLNEEDFKEQQEALDIERLKRIANIKGGTREQQIAADTAYYEAQRKQTDRVAKEQIETAKNAAAEIKKTQDRIQAETIADLEKTKKLRDEYRKAEQATAQLRADSMPDGIDKALMMQQLRYEKELQMLRDNLEQKQITQEQYDEQYLLQQQINQQSVADIYQKKATDVLAFIRGNKEERLAEENGRYAKEISDFKGNAEERLKIERQHNENLTQIEKSENQNRFSSAKSFLLEQLKNYVSNKIAELAVTESTESAKTGITLAGIAARAGAVLSEIGANVASAASSAFTAVVSTIRWITELIPFPFSLGLIPAGVAAIYGAYKGAKALFKFSEGGYVNGVGGTKDDKNPALLSNNEYVIPADAVMAIGKETFDYIRTQKRLPQIGQLTSGNDKKSFVLSNHSIPFTGIPGTLRLATGGLVSGYTFPPGSSSVVASSGYTFPPGSGMVVARGSGYTFPPGSGMVTNTGYTFPPGSGMIIVLNNGFRALENRLISLESATKNKKNLILDSRGTNLSLDSQRSYDTSLQWQ